MSIESLFLSSFIYIMYNHLAMCFRHAITMPSLENWRKYWGSVAIMSQNNLLHN